MRNLILQGGLSLAQGITPPSTLHIKDVKLQVKFDERRKKRDRESKRDCLLPGMFSRSSSLIFDVLSVRRGINEFTLT